MSYLKDFLTQISNQNFNKFLTLWEEYCMSDEVDADELIQLFEAIKNSKLAKKFGEIAESALPLWQMVENEEKSYIILKLIVDLQTSNSDTIVDLVEQTLENKNQNDPKHKDRLKMAGLKNRDQFQGALSRYDLLKHMKKGNVVFHTGGWGTGEILESSLIREQLLIEFENVSGRRDLSFKNAYNTLVPLSSSHFLARRFTEPDALESEGKADPVALVKMFLQDVGPSTAAEIKDELCDLVIPSDDWTKWWQSARAKLKKDPIVATPQSIKENFFLRKVEMSAEDQVKNITSQKGGLSQRIESIYSFLRDNNTSVKNSSAHDKLKAELVEIAQNSANSDEVKIQASFLLEQFFADTNSLKTVEEIVHNHPNLSQLIDLISIAAFKKKLIAQIKAIKENWTEIFLILLNVIPHTQIKDYLLKELAKSSAAKELTNSLKQLIENPTASPELVVWYFQKVMKVKGSIPFADKEGRELFFEAMLVLLSRIESISEYRELAKKIYNIIIDKRYEVVRLLFENSSFDYAKEVLLLASKSQLFNGHDLKVLRSLAEVAHPNINKDSLKPDVNVQDKDIIWTTEQAFLRVQEKIKHIGTVEVVDNAKEIEAARELGDLRENSEYKFAQERRARLQAELKMLSEQLNKARIITSEDISLDKVGIGAKVTLKVNDKDEVVYTILGPWDANPDVNILSNNSKLAQAMIDKSVGDKFEFKSDIFLISNIKSYI